LRISASARAATIRRFSGIHKEEESMKSRIADWIFRVVLALGLLAAPMFDVSAAAPAGASQAATKALSASNPNLISIPVLSAQQTFTYDGKCDQAEYNSNSFLFDDGGGTQNASVWLIHDSTYLYVCMNAPAGSNPDRFSSLYLDPQGDGSSYQYARQDDYSLRKRIDNNAPPISPASWMGSGIGPSPASYLSDAPLDTLWSAKSDTSKGDQVEYQIPLAAFKLNACGGIFGLAVYHHWFAGTGNDYGWPSNQWYDQPRTWQLATLDGIPCSATGKIAYVFRGDTLSATSFYNLLAGAGYSVTLIPLSDVLTTDFTPFKLTIIADDTGSLDTWGSGVMSTAQVNKITAGGTPILGLGEGGYAFFGKLALFIGWPRGWHGPQNFIRRGSAAAAVTSIFSGVGLDPVQYYVSPTNSVGIYLSSVPVGVLDIGLEDPLDVHASIIQQDCRMLWGNGGNPLVMNDPGKSMFLNTVAYTGAVKCTAPPDPATCVMSISKTASPSSGSTVNVGDLITYTINYDLGSDASCPAGKVVDMVPPGTLFVPGSAGTVTPDPGGTLTWGPVTHSGSVSFSVRVTETACATGQDLSNVAELRPSFGSIKPSLAVTHSVTCQVISLPTDQPMYAESEFKIDPYPLVYNTTTHLSVRVYNLKTIPQPVTVKFQSSPGVFGIGLDYSTSLGTASATVPGSGYTDVGINFVPPQGGIACIQATVTAVNGSAPLITQSCLDVTEVLQMGRTDTLSFPVRNNTSAAGTVLLAVDNTCPGWTASIAPTSYSSLASGATGAPLAVLSVTPGGSGLLGSRCHIDVQAWIGGKLIGGIRKIDIAPVHLPLFTEPAWEEPEITFLPDPPAVGVPGQVCIRLVNPLPDPHSVTVDFSVADFGAGIGFVHAATAIFDLPATSVTNNCTPWTPAPGGTLHRCVLATLHQDLYQDQTSQHNIDVVRPSSSPSGLTIPFSIGNPDLVSHELQLVPRLVGINKLWTPIIEPLGGTGTIPSILAGGGRLNLQVRFSTPVMASQGFSVTNPPALLDFTAGERHSVEVTVLLDGVSTGGFTVQVEPFPIYLPMLRK
jgi:uncharacterized repeat protein (TIGR01451 family)